MLRKTGTDPLKKVLKKPEYKLLAMPSLDVKGSRSVKPAQMQMSYRDREANLNSIGNSFAKKRGNGISEIQVKRGELEEKRSMRAQAGPLKYNSSRKQRVMKTGIRSREAFCDNNSEHYNELEARVVRASRVDETKPVSFKKRAAETEKRPVGTNTPEYRRYEPERVVNFPSGAARTETRQARRGSLENKQEYDMPAAALDNRPKAARVKRSAYEEKNDDSSLRNGRTESRRSRTVPESRNASVDTTPEKRERRLARTEKQNNEPERRRAVNPESPNSRETFRGKNTESQLGGNITKRRHEVSDTYYDKTKVNREEIRPNRASSRMHVKAADLNTGSPKSRETFWGVNAGWPKSREAFWGGSYAQRKQDRSQPLTRMQRKKAKKFLKEDIRNGYRHPEGYRNIVEASKTSKHGASLYPLKKRDQWNVNPRKTLILAVSGLVLTIAVLIYLIASGSGPQISQIQQQPLQTIIPAAEAGTQASGLPAGVAASSPTPQPMEEPTPDPAV